MVSPADCEHIYFQGGGYYILGCKLAFSGRFRAVRSNPSFLHYFVTSVDQSFNLQRLMSACVHVQTKINII